ncbi:MAG: TIR domain-containing protein [Acidobacteria bacterium]|nr:MAG: TIR domain-containing protein [Acidobacteriota bacterium]
MSAFVTYAELKQFGSEINAGRVLREASAKEGKTVFLSHSSSDDELLPGVIRILEGHGGMVYVDDKDPALEGMDIFDIANRLREAVNACRKLVLLVTPRSKTSAWIPWELGLGDGKNRDRNVALFPSAETASEQRWSEQEYLGLYQRIIWAHFQVRKKANGWCLITGKTRA